MLDYLSIVRAVYSGLSQREVAKMNMPQKKSTLTDENSASIPRK